MVARSKLNIITHTPWNRKDALGWNPLTYHKELGGFLLWSSSDTVTSGPPGRCSPVGMGFPVSFPAPKMICI